MDERSEVISPQGFTGSIMQMWYLRFGVGQPTEWRETCLVFCSFNIFMATLPKCIKIQWNKTTATGFDHSRICEPAFKGARSLAPIISQRLEKESSVLYENTEVGPGRPGRIPTRGKKLFLCFDLWLIWTVPRWFSVNSKCGRCQKTQQEFF